MGPHLPAISRQGAWHIVPTRTTQSDLHATPQKGRFPTFAHTMEVVMDGVPAALVGSDLIFEPQAARHCVVRPLGRPQQEGGLLALDALSVSLGQRPGLKSPESVLRHAAWSRAGFFAALPVFFSDMIHAQPFRNRFVDRKFPIFKRTFQPTSAAAARS